MRRLGLAVVLVLAACGGGHEFDEDAVRRDLGLRYPAATDEQVDRAVDALRDSCSVDDDAFEFVVAAAVDEGDGGVDDLLVACPERTQAVLDDFVKAGIVD